MNEGDVAVVFSQYGEIADLLLVGLLESDERPEDGALEGVRLRWIRRSKVHRHGRRQPQRGFGKTFLSQVCGRNIKVDHVREFKLPKEYMELKGDETPEDKLYQPSGPDGRGWGQFRRISDSEAESIRRSEMEFERRRNDLVKKRQLYSENMKVDMKLDEDEMWEERLMNQMKSTTEKEMDELKEKLRELKRANKKEKKKSKKDKKEKKKDKEKKVKEAKKEKHRSRS
jgi:hypothetical protein